MRAKQLCLLLAALALAACSDNQDLRQKIQDVKNSPGEPVPPLPPIVQPEVITYIGTGLRDPFTGSGNNVVADVNLDDSVDIIVPPQADVNRRREFLESFELDSLTMVGTLNWGNQLYGLVADPDGLIHRVAQDNYMGRNNGQVQSIFDDRIELKEYVSDGRAWLEKDAQLALEEG